MKKFLSIFLSLVMFLSSFNTNYSFADVNHDSVIYPLNQQKNQNSFKAKIIISLNNSKNKVKTLNQIRVRNAYIKILKKIFIYALTTLFGVEVLRWTALFIKDKFDDIIDDFKSRYENKDFNNLNIGLLLKIIDKDKINHGIIVVDENNEGKEFADNNVDKNSQELNLDEFEQKDEVILNSNMGSESMSDQEPSNEFVSNNLLKQKLNEKVYEANNNEKERKENQFLSQETTLTPPENQNSSFYNDSNDISSINEKILFIDKNNFTCFMNHNNKLCFKDNNNNIYKILFINRDNSICFEDSTGNIYIWDSNKNIVYSYSKNSQNLNHYTKQEKADDTKAEAIEKNLIPSDNNEEFDSNPPHIKNSCTDLMGPLNTKGETHDTKHNESETLTINTSEKEESEDTKAEAIEKTRTEDPKLNLILGDDKNVIDSQLDKSSSTYQSQIKNFCNELIGPLKTKGEIVDITKIKNKLGNSSNFSNSKNFIYSGLGALGIVVTMCLLLKNCNYDCLMNKCSAYKEIVDGYINKIFYSNDGY